MDIQAAAQKIIDEANTRSPGAASVYLSENIRHHQDLCRKIVARSAKPAGWSLDAHEELIKTLVSAETELRSRRIAA